MTKTIKREIANQLYIEAGGYQLIKDLTPYATIKVLITNTAWEFTFHFSSTDLWVWTPDNQGKKILQFSRQDYKSIRIGDPLFCSMVVKMSEAMTEMVSGKAIIKPLYVETNVIELPEPTKMVVDF